MKANETHLQPIISRAEQQFIVPLFQRPYSWDKKEWQDLWNDLLELFELDEHGKSKNHFLGSIVTIPVASVPHGIAKYVLIDGQQRLTTLFILLMLIRNNTLNQQLAEKIHEQQLVNKFAEGLDYYKLLPTQQDRFAFQTLIQRQSIPVELENTQIIKCYSFFDKKLKKDIDVEKLSQIISNQLAVVSIVLDHDENPHLVFESLNARGKPLTQADLIRNYFFMRIPVDKQQEIFDRDWRPMQETLGDNLTECIRHYLMAVKATEVKKPKVYITLKNRIDNTETDILDSLKEMTIYTDYYRKILFPEHESVLSIQRALKRIKRIEVTVAYPFLLRCYHDYTQGSLSETEFGNILNFLENLVIRRSVCNLPSHDINKIFPILYREAKLNYPTEFVHGVALILQNKGYPNDAEFKEALTTTNFYSRSEGRERTQLILESLESNYQHKEGVDFENLSIEHIMPQTIKNGSWWQSHLGEDWETVHELYVHTLGNLTLTDYDHESSHESFPDKQKKLAQSHLELNRYFISLSEWKKEQIKERAKKLADLALTVWPYFGDENQSTFVEIKGTKPSYLMIADEEFVVRTWRDVLKQTLNFLAKKKPGIFESLIEKHPRFISKNANTFQRSIQLVNGYHIEVNLNADAIYRFCQQAVECAGYSREDWQVDYQ